MHEKVRTVVRNLHKITQQMALIHSKTGKQHPSGQFKKCRLVKPKLSTTAQKKGPTEMPVPGKHRMYH